MHRLPAFVFAACGLFLAMPAGAQETEPEPPASAAVEAAVMGLSADDMLNIRQSPSALGKTLGRLPNGALVHRHECRIVERYEWCRVDAPDAADGEVLSGWAPARYLRVLDMAQAGIADPDPGSGETPPPGASGETPSHPGIPAPTPAPRGEEAAEAEEADAKAARLAGEAEASALPPGLEARFATGSSVPINQVRQVENGPAPEAVAEDDAAGEEPAETDPGDRDEGSFDPSAPTPTPRPGAGEPAAPPPDAAQPASAPPVVAAAVATPDGTGGVAPRPEAEVSIPCARYVGQPMGRCAARIASRGDDAAAVTVLWPDGGSRLIEFRAGAPAGSSSREALRYTREGGLYMIRIGDAERFEILDALAFDR